MKMRRINSASVQDPDGFRFSRRSCSLTFSSIRLRRGAFEKSSSGMSFGQGEVMRAITIRLEYQAVTAPTP